MFVCNAQKTACVHWFQKNKRHVQRACPQHSVSPKQLPMTRSPTLSKRLAKGWKKVKMKSPPILFKRRGNPNVIKTWAKKTGLRKMKSAKMKRRAKNFSNSSSLSRQSRKLSSEEEPRAPSPRNCRSRPTIRTLGFPFVGWIHQGIELQLCKHTWIFIIR